MRSRPGTGDLAKQLSSALDDWGMDEETAGEGTSDLFKRIDDKMTLLDDYTRGNTFQIGSEHRRLDRELDQYIFSLQLRPSRHFVHQTALTGEKKTQNPKIQGDEIAFRENLEKYTLIENESFCFTISVQ